MSGELDSDGGGAGLGMEDGRILGGWLCGGSLGGDSPRGFYRSGGD